MKHTSKSWTHGEEQITSEFPSGAVEISDGSGYVVAYVPIHWGSSRYIIRKDFPRLIAAAPELLEALKNALSAEESRLYSLPASDDYAVSVAKDGCSARIGRYRAAIAKATGQQ